MRGVVVVVHAPDERGYRQSHEKVTRTAIAEKLAALKGFAFAGEYEPSIRHPDPVYFVPSDTLVGDAADDLRIRSESDLFGGVVPHPFVGTKAISHPLVEPDACRPVGWSHEFERRVHDAVLPGFAVFTLADARRAGARLLQDGPLRLKPVRATGGRGQIVVSERAELEPALGAVDSSELPRYGLVLEQNLTDVKTYSVGQVRVGDLVATYHGTQRLTPDNTGAAVYGGSDLVIVRGDFEALLALDLPQEARLAVAQARAYDAAAMACFPGLFASRRNYDVVRGLDCSGRDRCGVLEQSWRVGGASSAEIAALEAFRAESARQMVYASCVEVYGEDAVPPPQATVSFRGVDERVGAITKYMLIEPDVDAR